jgi:hypothetical protein
MLATSFKRELSSKHWMVYAKPANRSVPPYDFHCTLGTRACVKNWSYKSAVGANGNALLMVVRNAVVGLLQHDAMFGAMSLLLLCNQPNSLGRIPSSVIGSNRDEHDVLFEDIESIHRRSDKVTTCSYLLGETALEHAPQKQHARPTTAQARGKGPARPPQYNGLIISDFNTPG